MKEFLIALQFLTILPVQIKAEIKAKDFGKALFYFPIVGMLIGLLLSLVALLLGFLPDLVIGAAVLAVSVIITAGIHLDGFADTCDGFYGSRPKEEILKIMRDSRIGVMGVAGVVILLLLKFTLLVSIPRDFLWKSLMMMAAFARWSQGFSCLTSGYARRQGKAKFFIEYASEKDVIRAGLLTLALFLLLAGLKGALIFIMAFLCVLLFTEYVKRKIGAMTGDTIGATSEIAEAALLFFALVFT